MKIPIFEEIILHGQGREFLTDYIPLSKIGRVPTYINTLKLKKNELVKFLDELELTLLKNNLSPIYPYPLYVLAEEMTYYNSIPIVRSVNDLPEHFFKKVKRPNNKEMQLLNKLYLRVEKVNNLEMDELFANLIEQSVTQKDLYNETKNLYFFETLHHFYFPQKETPSRKR